MAEPARVPETIDPVGAEVVRCALETVAYEMATHVSLTATTPILNQSNERNATILDHGGRLAALSVGIPQFMLSSTLPVRFALEFFAEEGLNEGDVLVANDPYHGGGHLPDYNVFAPVVVDDELVLIASIQCHHADTGGGMPGGYNVDALDIWAEGVRFPAVKVYDRGVERRDVVYLLQTNNRTPTFIGDLRAQIGAAQGGVRRLSEIIRRTGVAAVRGAVDHAIAFASQRFREEVSAWPDGRFVSDVYVDHDPKGNQDIHVHCAVTVQGDRLTVDFTGSDDRPELQAWSTFGNTRGYVVSQLASMMDPTIPKNEGFFDSIELIVPAGCVLNPTEGHTVAAGTHHPGVEVGEAVCMALAQVIPRRACPQIYKAGMPAIIIGQHPETGQLFVDHSVDSTSAYCSAVYGRDGWGSSNASFGNLIKATAEINESIFPTRHEKLDYRTDSGGPGKWRGCPGSAYTKRVTAPATVYTYMVGMKYPMPGVAGGSPGRPNRFTFRVGTEHEQVVTHTLPQSPIGAGEAYEYVYGGGGGWGDPLERDPESVREDVLDEYVSIQGARCDYGVVFTGSVEDWDLVVDRIATDRLRSQMRGASGSA
jgi:N-methylhydantoinase B